MALRLIYPDHLNCGIYFAKDDEAYEGGKIGQFASGSGGLEIVLADDTTPNIGIIDDSVTGSGYGTLLGTSYGTQALSTDTTAGSDKVGLFFTPGIYETDVYDPDTLDPDNPPAVNTLLYLVPSGTNKAMITTTTHTQIVGYFLEFRLEPSLVSPQNPTTYWMVFRFFHTQ